MTRKVAVFFFSFSSSLARKRHFYHASIKVVSLCAYPKNWKMSQGKSDAKYHAKIGSFCKQTGCWVEFFLSLLRDTCFFRIWKSDIFTAIFFFFFLPFQIPKISRTSFLKKDDPSERFFSFTIFHKHFLKNVTFSNRNSSAIFIISLFQKRRNPKNITNVVFKKRSTTKLSRKMRV